MWFWFALGLILAIAGTFTMAYDDYIKIKELSFDSEMLGVGLIAIGAILSGIMFIGLAITWLASLG